MEKCVNLEFESAESSSLRIVIIAEKPTEYGVPI